MSWKTFVGNGENKSCQNHKNFKYTSHKWNHDLHEQNIYGVIRDFKTVTIWYNASNFQHDTKITKQKAWQMWSHISNCSVSSKISLKRWLRVFGDFTMLFLMGSANLLHFTLPMCLCCCHKFHHIFYLTCWFFLLSISVSF